MPPLAACVGVTFEQEVGEHGRATVNKAPHRLHVVLQPPAQRRFNPQGVLQLASMYWPVMTSKPGHTTP